MSIRWDARNKRWRYEFDRYIQGRRERASKLLPRGWSQAQADAFDRTESARLYAVASGIEQADPLIETAVALYLGDKKHLKSYKAAAENLAAIAWAYMGKPMSALPEVAREVCAETVGASGRTLKPASIKQRLALLKAACRWAWKAHGLTQHDPTPRMQMPLVRNERQVYASRAEMLRLARACRNHLASVAVRVAFYSGMRLGEILRVEVVDGVLVLTDSKNGDRRAIPAHPRIRHLLPLLPLAINKRTLQQSVKRACLATGLDHLHFHDLRHSTASELVNAGHGLYVVGAVLGHRDPRSSKRYAHFAQDALAAAVGSIGKKRKDAA